MPTLIPGLVPCDQVKQLHGALTLCHIHACILTNHQSLQRPLCAPLHEVSNTNILVFMLLPIYMLELIKSPLTAWAMTKRKDIHRHAPDWKAAGPSDTATVRQF